jgi:hypothetical protein
VIQPHWLDPHLAGMHILRGGPGGQSVRSVHQVPLFWSTQESLFRGWVCCVTAKGQRRSTGHRPATQRQGRLHSNECGGGGARTCTEATGTPSRATASRQINGAAITITSAIRHTATGYTILYKPLSITNHTAIVMERLCTSQDLHGASMPWSLRFFGTGCLSQHGEGGGANQPCCAEFEVLSLRNV